MDILKKLNEHLKNRTLELKRMKDEGKKIVAYFAGEYVPEEMIYASGAIPIGLVHGGSPAEVDASLAYMFHALCPFSKATFGLWLLKEQPYYQMMDLIVAPIACIHLHRTADTYKYHTNIDVFRLGVPHSYNTELGFNYFMDAEMRLKERLEKLVGTEIKIEELEKAITLYNRMRELLKEISLLRRNDPSVISGLEFMKLNHASFYADPVFMVETLQSFYEELQERQVRRINGKPRLLLTGPNIALGDYKVFELTEGAGADIVVEEAFEGVRFYWENVKVNGDPYQNLAQRYLRKFPPAAIMRRSTKPRFEFISKLAKNFKVDGVIWYQLRLCETYDMESYWFQDSLKELDLPMLKLQSNYDPVELEYNRTRVETFIDMLKEKKKKEKNE